MKEPITKILVIKPCFGPESDFSCATPGSSIPAMLLSSWSSSLFRRAIFYRALEAFTSSRCPVQMDLFSHTGIKAVAFSLPVYIFSTFPWEDSDRQDLPYSPSIVVAEVFLSGAFLFNFLKNLDDNYVRSLSS